MENRPHRKHPQCHGRDDAEVRPRPAHAPPEVVQQLRRARAFASGPRLRTETFTQCQDVSCGCHNLNSKDVVDGQPVLPRKAAHATLQKQTDSDGVVQAHRARQPVLTRCLLQRFERSSPTTAYHAAARVAFDPGEPPREVHSQSPVQETQLGVPAPPHAQRRGPRGKASAPGPRPGSSHAAAHIGHPPRAGQQGGPAAAHRRIGGRGRP